MALAHSQQIWALAGFASVADEFFCVAGRLFTLVAAAQADARIWTRHTVSDGDVV